MASNRYIVTSQTALSIPGYQMEEFKHEVKGQELKREQDLDSIAAVKQPESEENRRSTRVQQRNETQLARRAALHESAWKLWNEEKHKQNDTEVGTEEGDTSLGNIQLADSNAKDPTPDLLVHYVVAGEIDEPDRNHVQEYYPYLETPELQQDQLEFLQHHHTLRAGIKVVDRCCALIGEIKALPAVTKNPKNDKAPLPKKPLYTLATWIDPLSYKYSDALEQGLFYCAAHFFTQDRQDKVILLPAVGPYWSWEWVHRHQVPEYDWISGNIMKTKEDRDKAAFLRRRLGWKSRWKSNRIYILGTPQSDEEFTKIRDKISSALVPISNQSVHPTELNFTIIEEEPLLAELARLYVCAVSKNVD